MKKILIFAVVVAYAITIVFGSGHYGPVDDLGFLSLFRDNNLWVGARAGEGRFYPLHGLDFYLVHKMFGEGVWAIRCLYIISALIFLGCIGALFVFFKRNKSASKTLNLWLLLFLVSPAMTGVFFRVVTQEKYVLLFFFAMSLWLVWQEKRITKRNVIAVAVLSLVSLLSKEASIALLLVGIIMILQARHQKESGLLKKQGIAVVGIALAYIAIYLAIYSFSPPQGSHRYGSHGMGVLGIVKSMTEWVLADPFLFLVFVPMALVHLYTVTKKGDLNKDRTLTYLSFVGLGYISVYFVLNMQYMVHYLTPVYGLAIPFVLMSAKKNLKMVKYALIVTCFLQATNVAPGINCLLFQKNNNKHFAEVVSTIQDIDTQNRRLHVFCGGDLDSGISGSLQEYLEDLGWVITSPEKRNEVLGNGGFGDLKHTDEIHAGDYVLVTPYKQADSDILPLLDLEKIAQWSSPSVKEILYPKDLVRQACLATKLKNLVRTSRPGSPWKSSDYQLLKVLPSQQARKVYEQKGLSMKQESSFFICFVLSCDEKQ